VLPVAEPRDAVLLHVLAPLLRILLQVAYPGSAEMPLGVLGCQLSPRNAGGTVATLTPAQRDGATIRRWERGAKTG
jgi:hypothetical protein